MFHRKANFLKLGDEVRRSLETGKPIVALESTLIAHGLPYPDNLKLATEMEEIAREKDVTPATIAILDGVIKVGLERHEIEKLASSHGIAKASIRDIPVMTSLGLSGATTVASTMQIAEMAGIKVFVTGGIGGVHRGGEASFDISADLEALARYNVVVICAGAKAVLDLPKTLERLETLGVPIVGYKSSRFPAFYFRDSGLPLDYSVETPEEVAKIMTTKELLDITGGLLIVNPIPLEYELPKAEYEVLIERMMIELNKNEIKGRNVTPYLLKRLEEESSGKTVKANIALIKNNLNLGCEIAMALSRG